MKRIRRRGFRRRSWGNRFNSLCLNFPVSKWTYEGLASSTHKGADVKNGKDFKLLCGKCMCEIFLIFFKVQDNTLLTTVKINMHDGYSLVLRIKYIVISHVCNDGSPEGELVSG